MGGVTEPSVVAPAGQSVVNLTSELLDATNTPLARQNLTLLRSFITLRLNSTDATFSAECAFGFVMADGDQVISGGFPDPVLDVDAPWLFWERRVLLPPSDSEQHLRIDIRARRKFAGNDAALMLIIDNDDASQSLEFAMGFRLLFGL